MKRALTLTLLLFAIFTANAQRKQIDSLKKLIATAKDDTSRIAPMSKLEIIYAYSKPDSALALANDMLRISKTAQYRKGEAAGLNALGNVYVITGNYSKALTYLLSALKIDEQINDHRGMARALGNIGTAYASAGDQRKAIIYFLQGLAASKNIHNQNGILIETLNAGDSYEKLNILDSALWYTRRAVLLSIAYKDGDLIGVVYNNLGNIYSKMRPLDTALYYYRKGIPLLKQVADDDCWSETSIGIAKIFQEKGQPDSALYYARQSIAAGWRGGFTDRVLAASTFLTNYFEKQGRLDSAFHYEQVLIAAKDSLYSQEKTKEFQNLSFAERQRQQEIQEQEIAYKTSVRYYLLLGVIVFFVAMSIVFWRNSNQRKKANRLLSKQKKEIEEQRDQTNKALTELQQTQSQLIQREKMASLGELTAGIAHEIQNPLNFVNNFSEVNTELIDELQTERNKTSRDFKNEDGILNDIKENEKKINMHGKRADFIVKGMLEHSRTGTGERQPTNINILAEEFFKLSYQGLRAKDKSFNSEMVTHLDANLPKPNVVQQDIGRVLLNLFNNAFYAVNQKAKTVAGHSFGAGDDYKPEVILTTLKENGNLLIKVKDNGGGIPDAIKEKILQPFFTTKPTGEGTGLGLSLSYDILVKGHKGTLDINSTEGEGSEFIVKLPLN